jgi:sn-glycerol 3-phosphate transport system substrate-binding protein
MYVESTAVLASLLKAINGKFELGTAYFPGINDQISTGGVSIGGASLWMMKSDDARKQAAKWEFIKFMVSPKEQAFWNTKTGYFPITTEAYNESVFKENVKKYPQFQTAINQLHDSSPEFAGALCAIYTQVRKIEETEIQKMLNNQQTEDQALKNMTDQINSALEDYNASNAK